MDKPIRLAIVITLTALALLSVQWYLPPVTHAQSSGDSQVVSWNCTGSPCNWGSTFSGAALVWPEELGPVYNRLGYTTSAGVYLPATTASGMTISLVSGSANIYAGTPNAPSHRVLATLATGQPFLVTGLATDEVISVQGDASFAVTWTQPTPDAPTPIPPTPTPPASQVVSWNCTGSPCNWGSTFSGAALVWPEELGPVYNRLGYTTSAGVYLPATTASGMTISLVSGSANIYAGTPNAPSHRVLATLATGQPFLVTGLATDEVISVQGDASFAVTWTQPTPDAPTPIPPTPTPPASQVVSWNCTGSPCNWGSTFSGAALVWPEELGPVYNRLGYTTSAGVYLPATTASGMTISLVSGSANIYAGTPNAPSHRVLATLATGQPFLVTGLATDEVISVQGDASFAVTWTQPAPDAPTPTATASPTATPQPCTDPTSCAVVTSVSSIWRCNTPGCSGTDWAGQVITWPSWSAYADNGRTGISSKTVFSFEGEVLYPYMGSWANGCEVTTIAGTALIVEWQRGTDLWRETYVAAGQTYTITLISPEDGALIEWNDYQPEFSVSLSNCNPQAIAKTPTPTPSSTPITLDGLHIGETNILGTDDSGNANLLIAQQSVLAQNATLESLSFYVTNADGQLRLSVYADDNGAPGALMAETDAFTPIVGWNTQNVLTPVLLPAGTYWLAYLAESNNLLFRVGGTGPARYYSHPFGSMPTTFSDTTEAINAHWSLYASFLDE